MSYAGNTSQHFHFFRRTMPRLPPVRYASPRHSSRYPLFPRGITTPRASHVTAQTPHTIRLNASWRRHHFHAFVRHTPRRAAELSIRCRRYDAAAAAVRRFMRLYQRHFAAPRISFDPQPDSAAQRQPHSAAAIVVTRMLHRASRRH